MKIAELRVKIKSLAVEATIIRKEERRAKLRGDRDTFWSLRAHRTYDVRRESRASLLAYGYLRGIEYRKIERNCHDLASRDDIVRIIRKFDPSSYCDRQLPEKVTQWLTFCGACEAKAA